MHLLLHAFTLSACEESIKLMKITFTPTPQVVFSYYLDEHTRLIVRVRGECLCLFGWNSCVAFDQ